MTFTKRIGIERYQGELAKKCAGLIEGETEDGQRWIIFMDPNGRPEIYWPERDEDGGVQGPGITLDARTRKFAEIMSDPDPRARLERMKGAVLAAERFMNDPEEVARMQALLGLTPPVTEADTAPTGVGEA